MDISSGLASWLLDEASTTFEIPTSISLKSQLGVARRCISTIHFMLIVACFLSLSGCVYSLPSMDVIVTPTSGKIGRSVGEE